LLLFNVLELCDHDPTREKGKKEEEEKTLKGRRKRATRGSEREKRKRNFLPLLLLYDIIHIYTVYYFLYEWHNQV
jgi:hypothetical protein